MTGVRIITFMLYYLLLLYFAIVHKPMQWIFNSSPRDLLKKVQLTIETFCMLVNSMDWS